METKSWLVATLHLECGFTRKRSVCTDWAMGWTVRGSGLGRGKGYLFFPTSPERFCGPPNLLFNWYEGFFPEVQRLGCEVDHSPPSGAEVQIDWR